MKISLTILASWLCLATIASPGDTTKVNVHNKTDITWYGNYDAVGVFPDGNTTYRQILLHYTMGCASGGCSDWDYTTKIELMPKVGVDSNSVSYPTFTVNAAEIDTFTYRNTRTFKTQYNSTTFNTDSVYNDTLVVLWYENAQTPTVSNRSEDLFEAGYYNYYYDVIGSVIDSIYVAGDGQYILSYHERMEAFDVLEPFELARVITPYGTYMASNSSGFNNNWSHTFTFDVTEFAHLLTDSLQVRAFYGGWSSGFSVTLDFDFIEGTPPRNTTQISNIYRSGGGGWTYQNSSQFETNFLTPKTIHLDPQTTMGEMRITPTGHGFDNNYNCAEFCPRNYYLKIDGSTRFTQQMWNDDCGLNPIYPQGGTWIYNRANWCPGGSASDYTHEITPFIAGKDSIELNLDMQNYSWTGTQAPSYIIDAQLIEYGDFNFNNDASISDVVAPSSKKAYSRRNPICGRPIVMLKNYGAKTLTSVIIKYKTNDNDVESYTWNGNLLPLTEIEVELPSMLNVINTTGDFYAWTENPNGVADEYALNDKYTSKFDNIIVLYPNKVGMKLVTNNNGYETSWELFDRSGTVVDNGNNLSNNTTYDEDFEVSYGCYTLKIYDSANDGLNWWANTAQGSGYARLRYNNSFDLVSFKTDFGTEIRHLFKVDGPDNISDYYGDDTKIDVFPNPSKSGKFTLKFDTTLKSNSASYTVTDITGKVIDSKTINNHITEVDLSNQNAGLYLLKFQNQHTVIVKELIIE
jgi:hypothetical protein